ncbi:phasin family protein [Sphingomonas sp. MMS24-J13]|uniref:phasin family protein n=1 Tax=Sphingomonas sp. MMS24-J13 TaxID=3238686 RepID=UPI00384F5962
MTDTIEQAESPLATPADMLSAFTRAAPDLAKMSLVGPHLQATVLKAVIGQQRETIDFLARRFDEELKFADAMSRANSAGDLYAACAGFYARAAAQYVDEARKIAELTSRNAVSAVQMPQPAAAA